jgi:hypothetical protein
MKHQDILGMVAKRNHDVHNGAIYARRLVDVASEVQVETTFPYSLTGVGRSVKSKAMANNNFTPSRLTV